MRLLTILPASGKAGGIVASHSRTGTRLQVHTPRRQPRSPSQQANRAIVGALAQAWRSLSASDQQAWNAAATTAPSGFNLFCLCNRYLASIGLDVILATPQPRPTFPAFTAFTATPIYTSDTEPRSLILFELATTPAAPPWYGGILRATQTLSPGKGNIRASDLRIIETGLSLPTPFTADPSGWLAAWGNGPQTGLITFELTFVDPLSGWPSPPLRASAVYSANLTPQPPSFAVTIEQEGTPIASIPSQIFEQDGVPIAGP